MPAFSLRQNRSSSGDIMRLIASLVLAAFFLVALPCPAGAASNLDCIAAAKGRKILWNSSWSTDKSDNNVEYKVVNVTEIDRIPTRQVTLDLVASGSARQSNRKAVIATEDRARALCERIVEEKALLRFPNQVESDIESLPFIKFTKDGWARAPIEPGSALALCRVGELRFSCPESDRDRFGANLRALEEELRAQVPPQ